MALAFAEPVRCELEAPVVPALVLAAEARSFAYAPGVHKRCHLLRRCRLRTRLRECLLCHDQTGLHGLHSIHHLLNVVLHLVIGLALVIEQTGEVLVEPIAPLPR